MQTANKPEVLHMVLQLLQLQYVPHGVAVEEGLCGGAPVDVYGGRATKHYPSAKASTLLLFFLYTLSMHLE